MPALITSVLPGTFALLARAPATGSSFLDEFVYGAGTVFGVEPHPVDPSFEISSSHRKSFLKAVVLLGNLPAVEIFLFPVVGGS